MKKDIVPIAGNSSDKRRPILTVSPAERQKKVKELKNPSKESLLMAEFEAYKLEFPFSSEEVAGAIKEATLTLKEEHKKEINKLKSELAKKEKELTTLKKQIDKVE